jgi:hypothetical protein
MFGSASSDVSQNGDGAAVEFDLYEKPLPVVKE